MKLATVGTSWITESFISSAKTVEGIELYAVYSRDEEKAKAFAEKHGAVKHFTDLERMAKDENIDGIYIASPNYYHYEQSKLCLQNGKNVICEKPATTTKTQMEELISIAEEKKLVYCEAIMSIHTDFFGILQNLINNAGIIRTAHFDFCQLSSKYPAYKAGKNPNIFNPALHTGCLMDIGVYNLYLAAALFGAPDKIVSAADFLESGADSNGAAILTYKDMTVTLTHSKVGQNYSPSEIIGDEYTIGIGSVSQLTGITKTDKNGTCGIVDDDISRDEVMSGEIRFFKRLIGNYDISDEKYIFAKNTALTVRAMCDEIRKQNNYPF